MEFRQLSYFVAVVEAGTITEASRRVHVAQPALTRQIRLLEEDLGTRLLDRHARGVRLTMAGRALYEEALLLLDQRSQIKARLTALGSGRTGTLRLGITVAHLWVPEVARMMGQYRAQYPGVAFEVFPLLSGPQLERLSEGTLDAGVVYLDGPDYPGLDTLPLKHDSLVLALPESSPWAKCPPQCLADLQEEDFVWGFRSASPMYYEPHAVALQAPGLCATSRPVRRRQHHHSQHGGGRSWLCHRHLSESASPLARRALCQVARARSLRYAAVAGMAPW